MALESGTTISALDETWPLATDDPSQADDHMRLIKAVLKAQFPGIGGAGFAIPLVCTEAELNYLSGTTSSIQTQLNTINTTLTSLQTQITALDVRITDLENA